MGKRCPSVLPNARSAAVITLSERGGKVEGRERERTTEEKRGPDGFG